MRTSPHRSVRRAFDATVLLTGLLAGLVASVGCGAGDRAADLGGGDRSDAGRGSSVGLGRAGGDASERRLPRIRDAGVANGIEVRTWTIDPLGGPLANALAEYAAPGSGLGSGPAADSGTQPGAGTGLDPLVVARWRENGFRLIEVPVEQIDGLEAGLPHIDSVRRLWLGQPTVWTGLASRRLASDGGVLGGRPVPVRAALVVRSWVEPGLRRGPIRVELALSGTPLDGGTPRPIIMNELLLTHRLDPGRALVLVPAPPDEVWAIANPSTDPSPDLSTDPSAVPATDPGSALVPEPAAGADLGGVLSPPLPTRDGNRSAADAPAGPAAGVGLGAADDAPIAAVGPQPADPGAMDGQTLGESVLVLPGRILSTPPRPAREVLVLLPGAR